MEGHTSVVTTVWAYYVLEWPKILLDEWCNLTSRWAMGSAGKM